jgi:hypothetical protein
MVKSVIYLEGLADRSVDCLRLDVDKFYLICSI